MQQRLTLIEESYSSNLVVAKGGVKKGPGSLKVEVSQALPAIGEEADAKEEGQEEDETGSKAEGVEEGEEDTVDATQRRRIDENSAESSGGVRQVAASGSRKFLDSCGIMISLADPVKVFPCRLHDLLPVPHIHDCHPLPTFSPTTPCSGLFDCDFDALL